MKANFFDYIKPTNFLPRFCGIEITAMVRHKMRGIDGNGKPIDFTAAEKKKINQGVAQFAKYFFDPKAGLTLQDLVNEPALFKNQYIQLVDGKGIYEDVEATTGQLVVVYRVGQGRS